MRKFLLFTFFIWTTASFSQDGTLDTTFNIGTGANERINVIEQLPDGKVLIAGAFTEYNGHPVKSIARLNSDGSLDESFITDYEGHYVTNIYVEPDGKIVIASSDYTLVRIEENGSADESFTTTFLGSALGLAKQGDKYIVSGAVFENETADILYRGVIRLNYDGSIDTTFSSTLNLGVTDSYTRVEVIEDNKIMVYGDFSSSFGNSIIRLNADGSVDSSFDSGAGVNGNIYDLVLLKDGNYAITGGFVAYNNVERIFLAKINSDGSLNDDVVTTPGYEILGNTIKELSDGRILLGGWKNGNNPGIYLVRLQSDGTLDMAFNMNAFNDPVAVVDVQVDGKILVGGLFTDFGPQPQKRIARLKNTVLSTNENIFSNSKLYPNPVRDMLYFEEVEEGATVEVYNLIGNSIYKGMLNHDSYIDMSALSNGVYIVKLQSGDRVLTQKVIKQ